MRPIWSFDYQKRADPTEITTFFGDFPDPAGSSVRRIGNALILGLVVYHFMFAPDWEEGCRSCSFWADGFNAIGVHVNHRDVTMVAVSRAPIEKLEAFKRRMGWNFKWLSSGNNDFNYDYQVSFTPEALENEVEFNYAKQKTDTSDLPGVSVFYQDSEGNIFHTYSAYSRGIDILNPAYNYLDLVPKGRDEAELEWPMAWLRYHDRYEDKSGNTRREAR